MFVHYSQKVNMCIGWIKCIDKNMYETITTFVHHCLGVFMCYSLKVNTCDAGEQWQQVEQHCIVFVAATFGINTRWSYGEFIFVMGPPSSSKDCLFETSNASLSKFLPIAWLSAINHNLCTEVFLEAELRHNYFIKVKKLCWATGRKTSILHFRPHPPLPY